MGLKDHTVETVIAVSDLDRSRRFYEEQLGLEPGYEEEQAIRYPCAGGTNVFIYLSAENAGQSSGTVAGWTVTGLDELMRELGGRGVAFERYDQPGIRTDEDGVFDAGRFRACWVTDPDGNVLAISEETPSSSL
jgi:catechol 2,3-dioxygenase-like lactoylglutathione lyase family enzyme